MRKWKRSRAGAWSGTSGPTSAGASVRRIRARRIPTTRTATELNEIEEPAPAPVPSQWKPLPPEAATTSMFGGLSGGLLLGLAPAFVAGMLLGVRALDWSRWQAFELAAALWLL